MEIGSKIKNARKEAGYTQERAAEALNVSRQTISNWENEKSYPDIISVIKMSDLYSVSLDHLLKEEKEVKKTYMEYLEDSTNTVKSNDRMTKVIMIAVSLLVYVITQLVFWMYAKGPEVEICTIIFKYVLLPISVILMSVLAGKNNWWGKGKWILVAIYAVLFLLVPAVRFLSSETEATYTFIFPNFKYLVVGCATSFVGLLAGGLISNKGK